MMLLGDSTEGTGDFRSLNNTGCSNRWVKVLQPMSCCFFGILRNGQTSRSRERLVLCWPDFCSLVSELLWHPGAGQLTLALNGDWMPWMGHLPPPDPSGPWSLDGASEDTQKVHRQKRRLWLHPHTRQER